MHAGKVFANNPQSEQLCARKDRDDGGEKRKSWNSISAEKVADRHIKQDPDTDNVKQNPTMLANCSGTVLNPVIIFIA